MLAFLLLTVSAAQAKDALTVGLVQFPPDMHPFITSTTVKDFILAAGRRTVTGYDHDRRVICVLCTEVPSLENGRARVVRRADGSEGMEVLFTLRSDLYFADGVPMRARDIAFAFEVARSFSVPPVIEAIEAVDDLTVKVVLRRKTYEFDRLTYGPIAEHVEGPIFRAAKDPLEYGQKSAFNRAPETPGLWMGPYRIAAFRPNQEVEMVPNAYWRGPAPSFQRVTFRLIENTAALQANLLSGDVDFAGPGNIGLTLDQAVVLEKTQAGRFDVVFEPSFSGLEFLVVQLDNPLLADARVRHALSMAVDRKTIVARLFDGRFTPAGSFRHPSQFGWDAAVKTWDYDPAGARALLAQAGFRAGPDGVLRDTQGRRFSIDIVTTSGNRGRELVTQVLQTQFKAIGVELVIKMEPARLMFGETLRQRRFQGLVQYAADFGVDSVPLVQLHSDFVPTAANNWSGTNYGGLRDAALDAALVAAQSELDVERRRALWRRILDIYAAEMPSIPLYFGANPTLTPKWLGGVVSPTRIGLVTGWIENWRMQ